jgi:polyhydroxybutyrate depolymerase
MHTFNSWDGPERFNRLLFTIPLLLLILACGATTPTQQAPPTIGQTESLEPGDATRTLVYAGIERTYILHIPASYDATRPTPLVLAFHGIGLDAGEMIRISGLNEQAELSGFIVAYPNGTGKNQSWNGGHCCGEAVSAQVGEPTMEISASPLIWDFFAAHPMP